MPRSIDEGFRDFLRKLTPSSGESAAAKRHRASIEACLKANFNMYRFFRTGSFGNGTSISGYSDVDYFASIPIHNLKQNSATTLSDVRGALARRFPITAVRVDCPAVVVPFGLFDMETTEITPADFVSKTNNGYHIYDIPDCSGGWMRSSPELHNAYVRLVDNKHNKKVKPLIRFIKAWKYYRNVPISSFYLEIFTADYANREASIVYDIDVRNVLRLLHGHGLRSIVDPMGVSGYISPCKTPANLNDAWSKLKTALTRADNARSAANGGRIKDAFEWWDLVYNGNYPGYYR